MAKLARRQAPAIFPELLYWLESPLTTLLPFTSGQTFRVEDYIQDNRFVIRAELPGLDPDKDIEVTVDDGCRAPRGGGREEGASLRIPLRLAHPVGQASRQGGRQARHRPL